VITKIPETKNGYLLEGDATNEEFQAVVKSRPSIRCIIVNAFEKRRFRSSLWSKNILTINNNVPDHQFYINTVH